MRNAVSPGDALVFLEVEGQTDVHHILSSIRTPTLVVQRTGDREGFIMSARMVAERIPGARLVELPGGNHGYMAPDQDEVLDHIERFVRGLRAEEADLDRVLATVLFTDIVGSTDRAARLGDRAWRDLLERHHEVVRAMVGRYRGNEVQTRGDGFFMTFDGPARGIRCALAIISAVSTLGLELRAGLHTGEVETIDGRVGGIAVHIGSRVADLAAPLEVLVSQTVKDLVVGSGLAFEDAGEHELKGVPDRWRLYRVVGSPGGV
jgi:class 3 adenylate cyclase